MQAEVTVLHTYKERISNENAVVAIRAQGEPARVVLVELPTLSL